ncbi:hypothetical protein IQ13_2052 [Lacibacter cauensis]|uniref:Uncharacterized protein n=2 Tax=Lacibacter cauensis TaxID=510947 RepID=A0A562SS25_9BACT|nr:hypothetical protein IQ13_2052 [Lacibacter cauensis]
MAGQQEKMTIHQLNEPNKVLCIAKYQFLRVSLLYNRKKRKPERDKIKRTLNIKNQMTTTLTVNSANGTLKQNNSLVTRMMRLTASFVLTVVAFATMSFTQDDTTKYAEDGFQNADSCCTVTFVYGNQQIMVKNANAFGAAEVRINNMDLNTWVNSLKAYSFKKFNYNMIGYADQKIDGSFALAEALNKTMAANYSRNMQAEGENADNALNNAFDKTVAAPLFGKMLQSEIAATDAATDKLAGEDADNKAKAAAFTKAVTTTSTQADELVDLMLYGAAIEKTTSFSTSDADKNIDAAMYKSTFKTVRPADATAADSNIDALLKSK